MRAKTALIFISVGACGGLTEPDPIDQTFVSVTPEATAMEASQNGALVIGRMDLADNTLFADNERIEVIVRGPDGERETLLLRPPACDASVVGSESFYACGQYLVTTTPSAIPDLTRQLRTLQAFILFELGGGAGATVYFPLGDVAEILPNLETWNTIDEANLNFLGRAAVETPNEPTTATDRLGGFLKLEVGAVIPGDGFLQVPTGDTELQLEYARPGADPLVTTLTVTME